MPYPDWHKKLEKICTISGRRKKKLEKNGEEEILSKVRSKDH